MNTKVTASVCSVLLVVGVAIGCVAFLKKDGKSGGGDSEHLSPQAKAVSSICQPTSYQDECVNSLSNAKSAEPKDLIKAAVEATKEAVKKARDHTDTVIAEKLAGKSESTKNSLEYCKKMLDSGMDDLQEFLDAVGDNDNNLSEKFYDLWSWVSSTSAYQGSCLDDLWEEDVKKWVSEGMEDARKLTSNAMAIVKSINEIFSKFGLNLSINLTKTEHMERHLLEGEDEQVPDWVSHNERKLLAAGGEAPPNAVVAKDGSGQFKTIMAALAAYKPAKNAPPGKYVIYIKAGVYNEQVNIEKTQPNVFMYGDGSTKTIIANSISFEPKKIGTSLTGTVRAFGAGFMAKNIGFQNNAGWQGHQAVALMIQGDKSIVFNCNIDGYQDSLYVNSGRQFYRNCVVSGTVDFIFGRSATVIQNSQIIVRLGGPSQKNTVTADGKEDKNMLAGIVIQNCRILPDVKLAAAKLTSPSFLGRPWKQFATTVVMDTEIGDFIDPTGWMIWDGATFHQTCHYKEFRNRGPGASPNTRVKWIQVVTDPKQIMQYTAGTFLGLAREPWLTGTGVPFQLGLGP